MRAFEILIKLLHASVIEHVTEKFYLYKHPDVDFFIYMYIHTVYPQSHNMYTV